MRQKWNEVKDKGKNLPTNLNHTGREKDTSYCTLFLKQSLKCALILDVNQARQV